MAKRAEGERGAKAGELERWGRYRLPALAVLVIALLGSVAVHAPLYGALGWLAEDLDINASSSLAPPEGMEWTEFEVEESPAPEEDRESAQSPEETVEPEETLEPEDEPARMRPERRRRDRRAQRVRPVEPEPEPEPEPVVPVEPQVIPEPPTERQSITQRSDDPEVEPPPNARFLAEENRRVEEETVAEVRSDTRDDEVPQSAASEAEETPPGEAPEEVLAEAEDTQGPQEEPASASAASEGGASVASRTGNPTPAEPEVTHDGFGTLRLPRPANGGGTVARLPRLGVGEDGSWSEVEGLIGEDRLREQREAFAASQRSRTQGGRRDRRWRQFRAASENYVASVRPGNQTALNAAASPFAGYLAAVHRRIHRQFAHRFLAGLPTWSTNPFSDPSLHTMLEITFNQSGSVHRVGVVRTSGFEPFDYGAFNAVMAAQPYPRAPDSILSGDGRVYVHWGFYRNHRQCGTFNARPYILPNVGGGDRRPAGPVDEAEPTNEAPPAREEPSAPPAQNTNPTVASLPSESVLVPPAT